MDHTTAERLRNALGDIQLAILDDKSLPDEAKHRLIEMVSATGFGLVDELEGVVR